MEQMLMLMLTVLVLTVLDTQSKVEIKQNQTGYLHKIAFGIRYPISGKNQSPTIQYPVKIAIWFMPNLFNN